MKNIYVKVKINNDNDCFYAFNCKGGWIDLDELNDQSKYISVQCDDYYEGARAFTVSKEDLIISKYNKVNPYID